MIRLPPVRRSVVVPLGQQAAFDLFFRRLPEWWPLATRSVALEQAASCHIEAYAGGRLYERARDGSESTWGPVLARFTALAEGASELPPVEGPGCIPAGGEAAAEGEGAAAP